MVWLKDERDDYDDISISIPLDCDFGDDTYLGELYGAGKGRCTAKNSENFAPKEFRPSLVSVYFPSCGRSYSYYNDKYIVKKGDLVFVEGSLAGKHGYVEEVRYHFKIRLSQYKRILSVVDRSLKGDFYFTDCHVLTFDSKTMPLKKVRSWFAPSLEDDDFIVSTGGERIRLENFANLDVTELIVERGIDYVRYNKVKYLTLNHGRGYALVEGTEVYEVEFTYGKGYISNLLCNCFCTYHCKHEVAALFVLKKALALIEREYKAIYKRTQYVALMPKEEFLKLALVEKDKGFIHID